MERRKFQMRMLSKYTDSDNSVGDLEVWILEDGDWQPFDLSIMTAGFQVFVYALFTCQHMYFRLNAAERGLVMRSSEGTISLFTDNDWNLDELDVGFKGSLLEGSASEGDTAYIAERMGLCPVSKNLVPLEKGAVKVSFSQGADV